MMEKNNRQEGMWKTTSESGIKSLQPWLQTRLYTDSHVDWASTTGRVGEELSVNRYSCSRDQRETTVMYLTGKC